MTHDLKPCPFGNANCMCQFCEKQCNNGLNCSDCNYSGEIKHDVYLCTGFVGDIDAYISNWRKHCTDGSKGDAENG